MNMIEQYHYNVKREIDRMSRDSNCPDDPTEAAIELLGRYPRNAICSAARELLADKNWSQDRQPYEWLRGILDFATDN